jgi:hypothetical protein
MAQNFVKRITFFKVPKDEDITRVLKAYEVLKGSAMRVSCGFSRPAAICG